MELSHQSGEELLLLQAHGGQLLQQDLQLLLT